MTPTQQLRAGAQRLRELAKAATEGPWGPGETERFSDHGWTVAYAAIEPNIGAGATPADAAYIAAMGPDVGLLLADLLDNVAGRAESKIAHVGKETAVWSHARDALALAAALTPTEGEPS